MSQPPPGPPPPEQPNCVTAATRLAERGWSVVPCAVLRDGHDSDGKAPRRVREWQKLRLKPEDIAQAFGASDNVGLLLGEPSAGLVDVDCDCPEACRAAPYLLPETPMRHGRPGVGVSHFWFDCPELQRGTQQFEDPEPPTLADGKKPKGTLVELRGTGGQTVVPPSLHVASGTRLAWAPPVQLAPAPVKVRQLTVAVSRVAVAALIARRWQVAGGRNNQAMLLGGWLAKNGFPREDAELLTAAVCAAALDNELDNRLGAVRTSYDKHAAGEVVKGASELAELWGPKTLANLGKWLGFRPGGTRTGTSPDGGAGGAAKGRAGVNPLRQQLARELQHHDVGNAERFIRAHADKSPERASRRALLYCGPLGGWFEFDESRWLQDATNHALLYAAAVAKTIEAEADATDDADKSALANYWAVKSQEKARLEAMLSIASSSPHLAARVEDFDTLPWALPLPGATLDLTRAGLLALNTPPHAPPRPDPAQRLTRLGGCAFDPTATAPLWRAFVARIFADDEAMLGFIQRLAGYCLFGGNPEQVLAIFHGSGANGKSTLLETLSAVLGELASTASKDALISRENAGNNQLYALAMLRAARLVVASETGRGGRLDEETVKTLTGGDQINARFSHQNFFTYRPAFTVLLATNHLPKIGGTDEGIWRRLLLVPFEVTIPLAERDGELPAKLLRELPGILNWCLEGLLWWHDLAAQHGGRGLQPPPRVQAATREYREDQDALAEFLADCCLLGDGELRRVSKAELHRAHVQHAKLNGGYEFFKNTFGQRIKALPGVGELKSGSMRFWTGIELTPEAQAGLDSEGGTRGTQGHAGHDF